MMALEGIKTKKLLSRDSYISRFNGGQLSDRLINAIKPEYIPVYEKMNFLTASNKLVYW